MEQPEKKRVNITREQIGDFYQVDEDGMVTQKDPNIIPVLDMSGYTEPYTDDDAMNGHLPFNPKNARLEIYEELTVFSKLTDFIADIKYKIQLLPNPNKDIPQLLHKTCLQAGTDLKSCQYYGRVVMDHTYDSLANLITEGVIDPNPLDSGPSTWREFLFAIESPKHEYRKAFDLWQFVRWLQQQIINFDEGKEINFDSPIKVYENSKKLKPSSRKKLRKNTVKDEATEEVSEVDKGSNGENKMPLLWINKESKQNLYDALKQYVTLDETGEHSHLKNLIIDNKKPDTKIIITCQVKEFGATFRKADAIPKQGTDLLSKQLPEYFVRNDGKGIVTLKPSILVKNLRGNL